MRKLQYCFWLVLLAHLLLFISLSTTWVGLTQPAYDTPLPAYVYREETNSQTSQSPVLETAQKQAETSTIGLEKPKPQKQTPTTAMSLEDTKGDGDQNINLKLKADKNLNKPLLKLLTKATVAHLIYPKIAVDFRTRGMAQVGFNISPNGQVTHISLLKSSGAEVLDKAAMAAIRNMSPVKNVNLYLDKTEFLVVDIVFG